MSDNVLVLQVVTTVDLELVNQELKAILVSIKRWCKWIKVHRLQSFVIITNETPAELRQRLSDVLIDRPGIGGSYCFSAPDDLVGHYGELEALRYHIDAAWFEVRQREQAKNVGNTKRRNFGPKSSV